MVVAAPRCHTIFGTGEDTTVREGIRAALQRIGPILGWTLVAATGLVVLTMIVIGGACRFVLAAATLQPLAIAVAAVVATGVIVIFIISSALSEIFRVAVCQYAVTGATAGAFDSGLLQNAFDGCTSQR